MKKVAFRVRLSNAVLRRAVSEAGHLVSVLDGRPEGASAALHRRHTILVLTALGWEEETPELRVVRDVLDHLCRELPASFELSQGEWLKLLGDRLDGVGEVPLGGQGAGVQVLTVMESRARTFTYLLVVGVNRGVFPPCRPRRPHASGSGSRAARG